MEDKLTNIATYNNSFQANMVKAQLEDCGIDAFLFDENVTLMSTVGAGPSGGIRLMVPGSQAEEALKILADIRNTANSENSNYNELCPNCFSEQIEPVANNWFITFMSVIFSSHFIKLTKRKHCKACDEYWVA